MAFGGGTIIIFAFGGLVSAVAGKVEHYSGGGTFYIPDNVIQVPNNDQYMAMPLYKPGPAAEGNKFGAYGLMWFQTLTFHLPSGFTGEGFVLEILRGMGFHDVDGRTSAANLDHRLQVTDGSGAILLDFFSSTHGHESLESSGKAIIPLDGANTSRIDITVYPIGNANGTFMDAPAAFIGTLAALWKVGQTSDDEQVHIVDLKPLIRGDCTLDAKPTNAADDNVTTVLSNDGLIVGVGGGALQTHCFIAMDFNEVLEDMDDPSHIEFFGEKNTLKGNLRANLLKGDNISSTRASYGGGDNNGRESSTFLFQVPAKAFLDEPFAQHDFANFTGEEWSVGNPIPYNWLLHLDGAYLWPYAKIQGKGGSGKKATVVDLSTGNYAGTNVVSVRDSTGDNCEYKELEGFTHPEMWDGTLTLDLPSNVIEPDNAPFLEFTWTRMDSDKRSYVSFVDVSSGEVLANVTLRNWEDDMSPYSTKVLPLAGLTGTFLNITYKGDDDREDLAILPFMVLRYPFLTVKTTTTTTTTTATATTATATVTTTTTTTTATTTATATTATVTTTTTTTTTTATATTATATVTTTTTTTTTATATTSTATVTTTTTTTTTATATTATVTTTTTTMTTTTATATTATATTTTTTTKTTTTATATATTATTTTTTTSTTFQINEWDASEMGCTVSIFTIPFMALLHMRL